MKKIQLYHYIVVVLGYVSMVLGKFIFLFKKKHHINFHKLDEIIINRSDKIGDAIITKPLLLLFFQYIKEHKIFSGKVTILASKLNKQVLEDLPASIELIDETKGIDTASILVITYNKIIQGIYCLYLSIFRSRTTKKALFIDFVGWWDMFVLIDYFKKGYTTMASCNLALGSSLLSHRIPTTFTTFQGNKNIIEPYIDLLESLLQAKGAFRSYVYDNIAAFYGQNIAVSKVKENILIFVGCKPERSFSTEKRIEIIECFAKNGVEIGVIDDNSNRYYDAFTNYRFSSNVHIYKNTFSLIDFKNFVSSYTWVIGLDGGGMNFVRNATNNITIYTLADCFVWSQFAGNNPYNIHTLPRGWFLGHAEVNIGPATLHNIFVANQVFGCFENFDPNQVYDYLSRNLLHHNMHLGK